MRVNRGALTPRRMAVGACVVLSGGLMTAAMAAGGPVLYSEYTNGGEREARMVQEDGTGDVALPKDVVTAATSPDGTRIAQVGLSERRDDGMPVQRSWLRVTAGDGSGPRTLVEERPTRDGQLRRAVTGTPVWSPDGSRVLVARTALTRAGRTGRAERLLCVVADGSCRVVGRVRAAAVGDAFDTDVVGWQRQDGPLLAVPGGSAPDDVAPRQQPCGVRRRRVALPTLDVAPLWNAAGFGGPLHLRAIDDPDDERLDPRSAGALPVADGTLAFDLPRARAVDSRVRCHGSFATWERTVRAGLPRLTLRSAGRSTVLPVPPGLRAGDGLQLAAMADGGALLVTRALATGRRDVFCDLDGRRRVELCGSGGTFSGPTDDADTRRSTRVWRYRPGTGAFAPVTTLSRAARNALRLSDDLTVARGDAVLAVSRHAIERVPLDGGTPTTIARGSGVSLDLRTWR
ncbi:hypothetical protein ACVU7I_14000 [Patulibacter sp. S7RM1-6]